ncbi:polysaccharide pyruvyl transferase family protein [Poseidonocella sedimentorum]|uniref:Exopolysaccharide biosynthesis protein EpsI, predicted pyruvyl transferase n=1 Tax=Poseidonocella sedimentorum TaxID=871652 RepID=A0A1I6ENG5_9RHOB|nr:polysaccharide pyruvyl transferase family protein [Poseidonocella sedimentorum]SFR19215.1 Exopolysaccharide biosynthesis protein EpsI, predicted pyruvyl transferase [Poseidonocella sedimentorum]
MQTETGQSAPSPQVAAGATSTTGGAPSPADLHTRAMIDRFAGAVAGFLAPGAPYALLDFPDHPNVGDSAIYTGELEFFDAHAGRPADYVCSLTSYREDVDDFCPEGPLFIHGGGNFGSVWRKHQMFRHAIIDRYRHRQVIQMAQSVHYAAHDGETLEETKRLIGQHPDFTMLVRDTPSFEFVEREFDCPVVMCPDAAHNMWHLKAPAAPEARILSLLRLDKEKVNDDILPYLETRGPVDDWRPQFRARSPLDRVVEKVLAPALPRSTALMRRREAMYRRQAWYRVNYGVRLLARGELVVSDRLHAHLLCGLMRKPHISLDNMYGKIQRYIEAWGSDGLVTQVSGLEPLKAALAAAQPESAA